MGTARAYGALGVAMVRLKALVIIPIDRVRDFGSLLAIGRAEAKHILRTRENVNVKNLLLLSHVRSTYNARARVEAKPLVVSGGSQRCG